MLVLGASGAQPAVSRSKVRRPPFQPRRSIPYCGMAPARSIVLIGMMGAGKSSVGRCLERRTGLGRYDTDEIISARLRLSIPEIFSKLGEDEFRRAETKALAGLKPSHPAIVVTGGGIILREENIPHLKKLGFVVWLDAAEEVLFERATRRGARPLLQTDDPRGTLHNIRVDRAALYERAADLRVDTTRRGHEEVAQVILTEVEALPAEAS
jgi:shikimate kinase